MNVQQSYFDFLQEQGRCKGTISIRLSKFFSKQDVDKILQQRNKKELFNYAKYSLFVDFK